MFPLYHSLQPPPATPGIYLITCATNKKIYVGSAVDLRRRWIEHYSRLANGVHPNLNLQRAWNKYGPNSFTFEILELVLTPEMLTAREQYWFTKLRPFGKRGFNVNRSANSRLGTPVSEATREKLRIANSGKPGPMLGKTHSPATREKLKTINLGKPRSEATKRKIAEARTGKTYGPETREKIRLVTLGHPVSAATRDKLRIANSREKQVKVIVPKVSKPRKPIPRTPEWNENIRLARLGHDVSPESRERMRLSHLGQNLGHPVSAETRTKIRETKVNTMQTLIVTSPDGEEFTVTGIRHFCIQHNLHQSAIMKVAKGKQTHHKGWHAHFPE